MSVMQGGSASANEVSTGWSANHSASRPNPLGGDVKHWQEQSRLSGHHHMAPPAEWDGALFDGLIDHNANQSDDTVSVSDVSTPPLDGPIHPSFPHHKSEMFFGDGPQPNIALWQDTCNMRQAHPLQQAHWQDAHHHATAAAAAAAAAAHETHIKREHMYSQAEGAPMHSAYFAPHGHAHAPINFHGAAPLNHTPLPHQWPYMRSAYLSQHNEHLAVRDGSPRAIDLSNNAAQLDGGSGGGGGGGGGVQTRRRSNTIVQTRRRAKSISKPAIQPSRRPITCPTCGERISSQRNLKAHSRERHEKVRPFVCLICITSGNGRAHAYSRKEGVKRHVKTCHPGCDPERHVGQTRSREHVNMSRPQNMLKAPPS